MSTDKTPTTDVIYNIVDDALNMAYEADNLKGITKSQVMDGIQSICKTSWKKHGNRDFKKTICDPALS